MILAIAVYLSIFILFLAIGINAYFMLTEKKGVIEFEFETEKNYQNDKALY